MDSILYIEMEKELKMKFLLKCVELDKTQKQVIHDLVKDWLRGN